MRPIVFAVRRKDLLMHPRLSRLIHILAMLSAGSLAPAEDSPAIVIPYHQTAPPGPALSPSEAVAKMEVPSGFTVELVASEPDIMNPVAMAIDERGRFWITESFEYPRRDPGPGRDRIKVLDDTDHDGQVDRVTLFAEGLNIPSGIAVGYGGVWVTNAPDLLFMQDTDGDGRADHQEVVLSGFGRTDTHELPNSLTWGPDGWLYGLNGVFNHSNVTHQRKRYEFTCALFRVHPRTREFQLFAEGTSNPWGIAFDPEGSAFVSACVIDHLWHLTESGYYHRQGGPYPAHTWKLESIVKHQHQMAAYCGLTYFDSHAYPAEYRDKLYMGNIHGGCINVDYLTRRGATYLAKPAADFLTAHDAWFMPVVQKTGPDGCLYVLDWYDRYHCYQDANRDPEGIDRGRGRLYRIRYQQTPRAEPFDLHQESDDQLLARLESPNVFYRELAQRLLAERASEPARRKLEQLVLDDKKPRKARLHGLWALIGGGPLETHFHQQLLNHSDATFRAWAVRAAGDQAQVAADIPQQVQQLASDASADVRLQVAVAARKLPELDPMIVLCQVLQHDEPDELIPPIVWQNLLPLLDERSADFVQYVSQVEAPSDGLVRVLPHAIARLLDTPESAESLARLMVQLIVDPRWETRAECLQAVRDALVERPRWREHRGGLKSALLPALRREITRADSPLQVDCQFVATLLGDDAACQQVRQWLIPSPGVAAAQRLGAFHVLAAVGDQHVLAAADQALREADETNAGFLADLITSLGRVSDPQVATVLLAHFDRLPAAVQPRAIEQLTQRNDWAKQLLAAIAAERLPRESLHINQVRRLQTSTDPDLAAQVYQIWGTIRQGRNPQVEESIEWIRNLIREKPGNAQHGQEVFGKTCGQCHQIYGQGEQVGPDITRNGRSSFDQLLSNVFDPNLVIGSAYQATIVNTHDGRTLSGLLVSESTDRVVLKLQGGKDETIARSDIDELVVSPLSLMPEGWEKQLGEQELVDLMHFLTLDGPPGDPQSKRLPDTPSLK
jgi:putative membrane-bound dehydrogenase-like protein